MKKTSIYLEPELDDALERYAATRGISKAEAVRLAVAQLVEAKPRPRIKAIGVMRGDASDVSANIDRYLAESGFGEE